MASSLALTGLATAGCAGDDLFAGGGIPLRYWNPFGGGDGVNMLAILDAFRAANPDVALEAVTLDWGALHQTRHGRSRSPAPDVAILHLSRMPAYASGLLDPFDLDLLAEVGVCLVVDEGAVEEFGSAGADPAFHDRVHARGVDAGCDVVIPLSAKMASKAVVYLLSRSRIRYFTAVVAASWRSIEHATRPHPHPRRHRSPHRHVDHPTGQKPHH